ncbi:MAG: DUF2232 domain-containing protein [Spirochaetia bacterium]
MNQNFSGQFKDPDIRRKWLEIAGFSVSAVLLYELGFLLIVFLVPIQILYVRRGENALLSSSVIILIGITIVNLIQAGSSLGDPLAGNLMLLDLLLPAALLAGLYLINTVRLSQFDRTLRFIFAAVLVGVISVPVVLYFADNEVINAVLTTQVEALRDILADPASGEETAIAMPAAEELISYTKNVFFSTYIFIYTVYLLINWFFGMFFSARSNYGNGVQAPDLKRYHVNDKLVWPLLISWGLVLLSRIRELGVIEYAFWNAALILLLFFTLQGAGIIWYLMKKKELSMGFRILIVLGLVALILIPGINIAVIAGIPLLGVSEIWIKYRMEQRS